MGRYGKEWTFLWQKKDDEPLSFHTRAALTRKERVVGEGGWETTVVKCQTELATNSGKQGRGEHSLNEEKKTGAEKETCGRKGEARGTLEFKEANGFHYLLRKCTGEVLH